VLEESSWAAGYSNETKPSSAAAAARRSSSVPVRPCRSRRKQPRLFSRSGRFGDERGRRVDRLPQQGDCLVQVLPPAARSPAAPQRAPGVGSDPAAFRRRRGQQVQGLGMGGETRVEVVRVGVAFVAVHEGVAEVVEETPAGRGSCGRPG
jgi:hypothetical protein